MPASARQPGIDRTSAPGQSLFRAACPSCEYDLQGTVGSWIDACPLECRCPECGTTHPSVRIFKRDEHIPAWSFEHRPSVWRWLRTSVKCFQPNVAWSGLLDVPTRPAWLIVFAVSWLGMAHVLAGTVILATHAWEARVAGQLTSEQWVRIVFEAAWPANNMVMVPFSATVTGAEPIAPFFAAGILGMIGAGVATLCVVLVARALRGRGASARANAELAGAEAVAPPHPPRWPSARDLPMKALARRWAAGMAYMLPPAGLTGVVFTLGYIATTAARGPNPAPSRLPIAFLAPAAAMMGFAVYWWTCLARVALAHRGWHAAVPAALLGFVAGVVLAAMVAG